MSVCFGSVLSGSIGHRLTMTVRAAVLTCLSVRKVRLIAVHLSVFGTQVLLMLLLLMLRMLWECRMMTWVMLLLLLLLLRGRGLGGISGPWTALRRQRLLLLLLLLRHLVRRQALPLRFIERYLLRMKRRSDSLGICRCSDLLRLFLLWLTLGLRLTCSGSLLALLAGGWNNDWWLHN